MVQALLEGILEAMPSAPGFIFKYNAIYYQEKSYLPAGKLLVGCSRILLIMLCEGLVSQFEIDRLEFHQSNGYLIQVKNE